MEVSAFKSVMDRLIQKKRLDDCVIIMKRLWISITRANALTIVKSAHRYNSLEEDLPFPKDIGGIMYESAGDYIYQQLTESQRKQIEESPIKNIRIEG